MYFYLDPYAIESSINILDSSLPPLPSPLQPLPIGESAFKFSPLPTESLEQTSFNYLHELQEAAKLVLNETTATQESSPPSAPESTASSLTPKKLTPKITITRNVNTGERIVVNGNDNSIFSLGPNPDKMSSSDEDDDDDRESEPVEFFRMNHDDFIDVKVIFAALKKRVNLMPGKNVTFIYYKEKFYLTLADVNNLFFHVGLWKTIVSIILIIIYF